MVSYRMSAQPTPLAWQFNELVDMDKVFGTDSNPLAQESGVLLHCGHTVPGALG